MRAVCNRISVVLAVLALAACASTGPAVDAYDPTVVSIRARLEVGPLPGWTTEANSYGVGFDVATAEDAFLGRAIYAMLAAARERQAAQWHAGADASDELPSAVQRNVQALELLRGQTAHVQVDPESFVKP
jgi:hypothetical protein